VRELDLPDRSVDHDHRGFGHNPHWHRTADLANHRFFRRRVRDGPLLDDAHLLDRRTLPDQAQGKGLPILIMTVLYFIALSLFLL
jgi:hypothetical protein